MKTYKWLKLLLLSIILIFLFSYFIEHSGYYEYNLQNKKNLTQEGIKQFEQDIKNGKNIDINNYLIESKTDYSNSLTKKTTEVNLKLNKCLKKFLTGGFDILGKFVK